MLSLKGGHSDCRCRQAACLPCALSGSLRKAGAWAPRPPRASVARHGVLGLVLRKASLLAVIFAERAHLNDI